MRLFTQPLTFLKARGSDATGSDTQDGFLVKAGSLIPGTVTHAFTKPSMAFRERLKSGGVIGETSKGFQFKEDYVFDSPSMAATVICGNPMNGRVEWKTEDGRTLKEIQEQRLESQPPARSP